MNNNLSDRVAKIRRELEAMKSVQAMSSNGLTPNNIARASWSGEILGGRMVDNQFMSDQWEITFVADDGLIENKDAPPLFQVAWTLSYTGKNPVEFFHYSATIVPYVTNDGWIKSGVTHGAQTGSKQATLEVACYCPLSGTINLRKVM